MIRLVEKTNLLKASLDAIGIALRIKDRFIHRLNLKLSAIQNDKQTARLERKLERALEPVFVEQIEEMADRLGDLVGDKSVASNLASTIFDAGKWEAKIIDAMFPIMAAEMLRAAQMEIDQIKADATELLG